MGDVHGVQRWCQRVRPMFIDITSGFFHFTLPAAVHQFTIVYCILTDSWYLFKSLCLVCPSGILLCLSSISWTKLKIFHIPSNYLHIFFSEVPIWALLVLSPEPQDPDSLLLIFGVQLPLGLYLHLNHFRGLSLDSWGCLFSFLAQIFL
jgi:hypothetical protein